MQQYACPAVIDTSTETRSKQLQTGKPGPVCTLISPPCWAKAELRQPQASQQLNATLAAAVVIIAALARLQCRDRCQVLRPLRHWVALTRPVVQPALHVRNLQHIGGPGALNTASRLHYSHTVVRT